MVSKSVRQSVSCFLSQLIKYLIGQSASQSVMVLRHSEDGKSQPIQQLHLVVRRSFHTKTQATALQAPQLYCLSLQIVTAMIVLVAVFLTLSVARTGLRPQRLSIFSDRLHSLLNAYTIESS